MDENGVIGTILTNYTRTLDDASKDNSIDFNSVDGANREDDWSIETLQQTRQIIQRIIVPCVVTIGIAGNLLTTIVLTRYSVLILFTIQL